MHWYDEADSVNRKVHSAVFAVEVRDRQLWGDVYKRQGFICWQSEDTCLRTRMNKINGLEENTNDDSSGSQ